MQVFSVMLLIFSMMSDGTGLSLTPLLICFISNQYGNFLSICIKIWDCFAKADHSLVKLKTPNSPPVRILSNISWS